MRTTHSQKQVFTQKKGLSTAASVLDTSSQSESLQRKADMANSAAQREEAPRPNNTGMPDNLKSGIESLSGFSMDDVRVHYNSSKPATVQALAYTQGTDIHVAPGQEKHLPHEAWHVAQQMAGRVSPTTNINGMPVNDNAGLEYEADIMGEKAMEQRESKEYSFQQSSLSSNIIQCFTLIDSEKKQLGVIEDVGDFCRNFNSSSISDLDLKKKIDELKKKLTKGYREVTFEKIGDTCFIQDFIEEIEFQLTSYSKYTPNENIDPDKTGMDGIHVLEEKYKRPDDVPPCEKYRLAIHKLMNSINILEISVDPKEKLFQEYLKREKNNVLEIQKSAKKYAVEYKKAMRDLGSDATVKTIQQAYMNQMALLTDQINLKFKELQDFFNSRLPLEQSDGKPPKWKKEDFMLDGNAELKVIGTDIWRNNWLTIKGCIDDAINSIWPDHQTKIKNQAVRNLSEEISEPQIGVQEEPWKLSYIGSLAKGYKGPPKQNTRFFSESFDVDANLDAPSVAYYLILRGGNIDRGQLIPTKETLVPSMDKDINNAIIKKLVKKLGKEEADIKEILSEDFETRVNVPDKEKINAFSSAEKIKKAITDSEREQEVRDKITRLRYTSPQNMSKILSIDRINEFLEGNTLSTEKHLPTDLLAKIEETINNLQTSESTKEYSSVIVSNQDDDPMEVLDAIDKNEGEDVEPLAKTIHLDPEVAKEERKRNSIQ